MIQVDNSNFTYNVVTEKDNDKRTRILQGTVASQQRHGKGDPKKSSLRSISDGVSLPQMKSAAKLPETIISNQ